MVFVLVLLLVHTCARSGRSIQGGGRMNAYRLVSFFFSCSSTMASCSLTEMVMMFGHTQTACNVNLLADPDVVHDCSCFALGSLWISNQVIPGTEHPPTEGEVLIGSAG